MKSTLKSLILGNLMSSVYAIGGHSAEGTKWNVREFSNLVTFGDSYTDEGRLGYFWGHNGQVPPPGTILPFSTSTSGGGITWGRWASIYTDATYFDYATGGAVCDNSYVEKFVPGVANPIPDVLGSEIPSFIADTKYINSSTGTNTVFGKNRLADNTVYAIWIGTNDLGSGAFFTDSTFAGTTITNYTDCIFKSFDALYAAGGRNFVLLNVAPLQLSPEYGIANGVGPNEYWQDKPSNITEIGYKMWEYSSLVNRIFSLQIPYEVKVTKRYENAGFALFDANSLITDIYNNPKLYLNGSEPLNVTGMYHQCNIHTGTCYNMPGSLDSFLWYDEVHPSARVDQIIAETFVNITKGSSKWATFW